jgi:endoglucanase Acf2
LYEAANPFLEGPESWGDKSQVMKTRPVYVVDTNTRAIPTNDWWTDLIFHQYAGNMFAHPLMVKAQSNGIYVEFPTKWNYDGTSVESNSSVNINASKFTAVDAKARRWGDWTVDFVLENEQQDANMAVTMAHGIPFVWVEYTNLEAELKFSETPTFFNKNGTEVNLPYANSYVGIEVNGDTYGLFLPELSIIEKEGATFKVRFNNLNAAFIVLGALPNNDQLESFSMYAYAIPRDSKVSWNYNENKSELKTTWNLTTENLKGESSLQTIQGWIPHHYRTSKVNFDFTDAEYLTARGNMKCAIGNTFEIIFPFNGLLPYMPAPELENDALYSKDKLKLMVKNYAGKSGYGGDTYWGGKDLLYYSQYMTFAEQLQDTQSFNIFKNKLHESLSDWYTFTPGEQEHYFAYHERWKTLLGLNASYGSDEFNDLHFHYGYFAYASGILAMFDDEFKQDFGPMAKHVVKQYANWNRDNTAPFFRTFDIWEGHSWAGGVGDAWNGNGQESTSEAMQGWGGMYTLALSLDDKEMRDAAIFGYTLESLGTQEYWFDLSKENIDYTKYTRPYNSNITGRGIGWWTWFSGDPVWMHSIQWLPISTSLKYLYQDTEFARWDYTQMWESKEIGGWDTDLGNESGLGNVLLSYLQIFDADSAARLFNTLWDNNSPTARDNYTGGISYYYTHAHRYLGEIQWNLHTNIPSSTVYVNPTTNDTAVVVYNAKNEEQLCSVFEGSNKLYEIKIPSKKLTVHKLNAKLTQISLSASSKTIEPGSSMQITATALDQYGASINTSIAFTASGSATISSSGMFSASQKGDYTITATSGSVSSLLKMRVNDKPVLSSLKINNSESFIHIGQTLVLSYSAFDQYNDPIEGNIAWSIDNGGSINEKGEFTAETIGGPYTITVRSGKVSTSMQIEVRLPLTNVAFLKEAASSSEENVGTPTEYINDGDLTTRWASGFSDPQWLSIDLGKTYNISLVNLYWEASFGKKYEVYITNDISTWENQEPYHTNNNSDGGLDAIKANTSGRYVILKGLARAMEYGYSLFEIEVYGTPLSEGESVLSALSITPEWASIIDNETLQYTAVGMDQYGKEMATKPEWSVLGAGTFDAKGLFTPSDGGIMKIVASKGTVSANADIYVEESPKVAAISFTVDSDTAKRFPVIMGVAHSFEADCYDQFGANIFGEITWTVSGGGTIDNKGWFIAETTGDYMVFANSNKLTDTAFISIKNIAEVDVAQGKQTKASSAENDGTGAENAVDGKSDTRWSSKWEDPQWFVVDLENTYEIYKIRINWEGAFGKAYKIQFSKNEVDWSTVYSKGNSDGGEDLIEVTGEAKFVKFLGTERATDYGYSFFDFEVYASGIVIENPILSNISISPNNALLVPGDSLLFTAKCTDQFGTKFDATPVWNVEGNNTINQTGLFVAGSEEGSYLLTASFDTIVSSVIVNISADASIASISLSPEDLLIKSGESIQYSAEAFDENQNFIETDFDWSANGGGTISEDGLFLSDSTPGSFTIFASIGAKVQSTTVTVEGSNSGTIIEAKSKTTIQLYPNPARDYVHIEITSSELFYELQIIDLFGTVHFKKHDQSKHLQIATNNLPKGLYIIEIKQTNITSYSKFIINK